MKSKNKDLSYYNKEDVPNAKELSFGIVVSKWNSEITDKLYVGALNTLIECGAKKDNIISYEVPGSYELVFGAKTIAKKNIDAIICLGSVIQGETKHFDYICHSVANGIKDLNIKLDIPVVFGVLTDNTMQQAIDRSGGKNGNKGIEAAITAIKMAVLNRL
tara:strand:+ start:108 stop:590 length:483 start_codon:yes stop_codon:yes gene_type:complete